MLSMAGFVFSGGLAKDHAAGVILTWQLQLPVTLLLIPWSSNGVLLQRLDDLLS